MSDAHWALAIVIIAVQLQELCTVRRMDSKKVGAPMERNRAKNEQINADSSFLIQLLTYVQFVCCKSENRSSHWNK